MVAAVAAQVAVGSGRALHQTSLIDRTQCPASDFIALNALAELSDTLGSECQLNYEIRPAALAGTQCAYNRSTASSGYASMSRVQG